MRARRRRTGTSCHRACHHRATLQDGLNTELPELNSLAPVKIFCSELPVSHETSIASSPPSLSLSLLRPVHVWRRLTSPSPPPPPPRRVVQRGEEQEATRNRVAGRQAGRQARPAEAAPARLNIKWASSTGEGRRGGQKLC